MDELASRSANHELSVVLVVIDQLLYIAQALPKNFAIARAFSLNAQELPVCSLTFSQSYVFLFPIDGILLHDYAP